MQRNVKIIHLFLISADWEHAELPNSWALTDISRKQRAPFTVLLNERRVFRASRNTIFLLGAKEAQTQAVIVIEWFITESKTHEDYSVAVCFFNSFLSGNGRGAGLK